MGVFATQLRRFLQNRIVRMVAGLMVAGFGVWGILRPLLAR
jgi:sulfite exporter TauE/SafE